MYKLTHGLIDIDSVPYANKDVFKFSFFSIN